jgi:hypothetical protein
MIIAQPITQPDILLKDSAQHIIIKDKLKIMAIKAPNKIPSFIDLRLNIEITKFVRNLIENAIKSNKNKKINKKALVIENLSQISGLSHEEPSFIDKTIEYLANNGIVKKTTMRIMFKSALKVIPGLIKKTIKMTIPKIISYMFRLISIQEIILNLILTKIGMSPQLCFLLLILI